MRSTLPTAYTYGKSAHYPLTHIVRMELLKSGSLNTLYISTQHTGSVTARYSGATVTCQTKYLGSSIVNLGGSEDITGLGEVEYQVDLDQGGNVSATDQTALLLLNQTRFSSEYEYDMENQNVEIWEGYMPPSGSLNIDTDMILRFKGIMRDVGSYDYERFEVPCVSTSVRDTRLLPFRKINETEFPQAPEEVYGQAIPIVFGDFYYQGGANIQYGWDDVIPAFCVQQYTYRYVVADHNLGDSVWSIIYKTDYGMAGTISSNTSHGYSSSLYTLSLTTTADRRGGSVIYADFYIMPSALGYYTTSDLRGDSNTEKVMDRTNSTYYHLSGSASNTVLSVAFDGTSTPPGKLIGSGSVFAMGAYDYIFYVNNQNRSTTIYADVYNRDKNLHWVQSALSTNSEAYFINHKQYFGSDFTWENFFTDEIALTLANGHSVDIYDMYVKVRSSLYGTLSNTTKRPRGVDRTSQPAWQWSDWPGVTKPKRETPTNIYAATLGVPTPAGMARGGYVAGDTIDNPAYAIEYLLRYKLNVSGSNIDTGSFDNIGNKTTGDRKSWNIDGYMVDQRDAFDWMAQICYEFSLALVHTNEGKYRLASLQNATTEDYTITSGSIATENGIPLFSLATTPTDSVQNNIHLSYRYDYATKAYLEDIYVADVNDDNAIETNISSDTGAPRLTTYSAFIGDSISRYGMKTVMEREFNFIRQPATAEKALKSIIEWNAFKHLVVRATLMNNSTTRRLQVGDKIKVNMDLMPTTHRGTAQFIISRINYPAIGKVTEPYINIEAVELPGSSLGLPGLTARYISSEDLGLL